MVQCDHSARLRCPSQHRGYHQGWVGPKSGGAGLVVRGARPCCEATCVTGSLEQLGNARTALTRAESSAFPVGNPPCNVCFSSAAGGVAKAALSRAGPGSRGEPCCWSSDSGTSEEQLDASWGAARCDAVSSVRASSRAAPESCCCMCGTSAEQSTMPGAASAPASLALPPGAPFGCGSASGSGGRPWHIAVSVAMTGCRGLSEYASLFCSLMLETGRPSGVSVRL